MIKILALLLIKKLFYAEIGLLKKAMRNKVLILGSGTSTGVPITGCKCSVCTSNDVFDKRMRSSILITNAHQQNLLVDTSPDLRTQLLRANIGKIDAAVLTHTHADHLHGIDDLRPFCFLQKINLPVYSHPDFHSVLLNRFDYAFVQIQKHRPTPLGGGAPTLDLIPLPEEETIWYGETAKFFLLPHGRGFSTGMRYGNFAYLIDCHEIPSSTLEYLKRAQLELLLLDCCKRTPHHTHLHLAKSLEYAKIIGAKQTGLIHLSHDFSHRELTRELTQMGLITSVFPVFDQQLFEL